MTNPPFATPEMLSEVLTTLTKQLRKIDESIHLVNQPPLYADLRNVTKMFRLYIHSAI